MGDDALEPVTETYTPYPPLKGNASIKTRLARELLELNWPLGSPFGKGKSAPWMAKILTQKYSSRFASRVDGQNHPITKITEYDIKRALNRKTYEMVSPDQSGNRAMRRATPFGRRATVAHVHTSANDVRSHHGRRRTYDKSIP